MSMYKDEEQSIIANLKIAEKEYIHIKTISFLSKEFKIFRSPFTGSVSGFVGTEYWSGWYGMEEKQDVKKVILDLCEYVCDYYPIQFKAIGTLHPSITIKKSDYKNQLKSDLFTEVPYPDTLTFRINYKANIFIAKFLGNWKTIYQKYLLKDKFIEDGQIITSAEVEPVEKNVLNELTEFFDLINKV